jgi:NAD(P)-dependent dehydrogenase (short-subunit alcohol dehydrogenase family)
LIIIIIRYVIISLLQLMCMSNNSFSRSLLLFADLLSLVELLEFIMSSSVASLDPSYSLVDKVRQSPPVDLTKEYDPAWLKGKTALITGGASGFGEGFARKWAAAGANVIIGDVNVQKGDQIAREITKETGNKNCHFIRCDVTDWDSQVNFFKEAVKLSPHGGIDLVVANAGISELAGTKFEQPSGLDAAAPTKPNFICVDVNLYGVLYTSHLAIFWLQKNPQSKNALPSSNPVTQKRDRALLLIGSVASIAPIPTQPLYGVSKHGVMGLFRTLRATEFVNGIRVNMLCPYFIDTPIVPAVGRLVLAGSVMGKVSDVIDAGTRLAADTRICGRALVVGPRVDVTFDDDGVPTLAPKGTGTQAPIWEAYADDWEECEVFSRRTVGLLNSVEKMRGWGGWASDVLGALRYGFFGPRKTQD